LEEWIRYLKLETTKKLKANKGILELGWRRFRAMWVVFSDS